MGFGENIVFVSELIVVVVVVVVLFSILVRIPHHWDRPNNLSALNAVAKPTSSGFLFMNAAIISTIAGKLHGSLRWKVQ